MQKILEELKLLYTDSKGKINPSKRQSLKNRNVIEDLVNSQSYFKNICEILWAISNNTIIKPTCIVCNGDVSLKNGIKNGFFETCSVKCAANNPIRKDKIKQTELNRYGGHHTQNEEFKKMIKEKYPVIPGSFGSNANKKSIKQKYGVDNVFQSTVIKNKIKQTNQTKYGVDNPLQNLIIREKANQTKIERYGQSGWNPIQTKLTNLERFGVDNPLKSKEIRDKIKKTNMERYGVEYAMQNPTIFDKCMMNQLCGRYKYKEMTMPSGKIIKYQGYENHVIKHLLNNEISEDDLCLERANIPVISYEFEGRLRRYYPDIFIKSKKMLIEVKSTYTFNREVEKNIAKHIASKKSGFHHIIIIWDVSKDCIFEVINL